MKKTKLVIKIIAIVLAIISVASIGASAAPSHVYYSDLFFGYHPKYLYQNSSYTDYRDDTSELMYSVFDNYIDSGDSVLMKIKTGLSDAMDLKAFFELCSDAWGNTDYNYNNALDKANEAFAREMLSNHYLSDGNSSLAKGTKVAKKLKDVTSLYNNIEKNFDFYNMTDEQIITTFYSEVSKSGIFVSLSQSHLKVYTEVLLPNLSKLGKVYDYGSKALAASQAITLALMIEDIRMSIIDDIIENSPQGTYLYDGMTRLKSQLNNGWKSYILSNYVTDTVVSELCGILVKSATSSVSSYGLVTSILKVASWVTFDLILDVPSLEDVLVQQTLTQYRAGMSSVLMKKAIHIVTSDDVFEFEDDFSAWIALTNVALDKTLDLANVTETAQINAVKSKYANYSYETYIESVTDSIYELDDNEREIKPGVATAELSLPVAFKAESDELEPGYVYTFKGEYNGNISLSGSGSISYEKDNLIINGNVSTYDSSTLTLNSKPSVEIKKDLSVNGNLIFNEGRLTVKGNCNLGNGSGSDYISMTHGSDYLIVDGKLTLNLTGSSTLSKGIIKFKGDFSQKGSGKNYYETGDHRTVISGDSKQVISWENPSSNNTFGTNLELQNTDIEFATPIYNFYLNQDTPLPYNTSLTVQNALDLNGYETRTFDNLSANYLYADGASLAVTGDLKVTDTLSMSGGNLNVENDFKASEDEVSEYSKAIEKHAINLNSLLLDMIEVSKISSGAIEVNPDAIDLGVAFSQGTEEFYYQLNDKNLNVVANFVERPIVYADSKLIWRVIQNLLSNICKYAMPGTNIY